MWVGRGGEVEERELALGVGSDGELLHGRSCLVWFWCFGFGRVSWLVLAVACREVALGEVFAVGRRW